MLNRTIRSLAYSAMAVSLASCGLFTPEKILPEGERISVLSSETEIKPDYAPGYVKIKLPQPQPNSRWSQSGGNAKHVMSHLKSGNQIEEYWTANFGEGASKRDFLIAAPVVAHRVVFAIDADAVVTARRLDDGREIWHKRLKPVIKDDKGIALKGAGIAYNGQRLFATTGFGGVFALEMKTGKEIWRYDTEMPIRIAPTTENNRLLVQTIDNTLIALDALSGKKSGNIKPRRKPPLWSAAPARHTAAKKMLPLLHSTTASCALSRLLPGLPCGQRCLSAPKEPTPWPTLRLLRPIRLSTATRFLRLGTATC